MPERVFILSRSAFAGSQRHAQRREALHAAGGEDDGQSGRGQDDGGVGHDGQQEGLRPEDADASHDPALADHGELQHQDQRGRRLLLPALLKQRLGQPLVERFGGFLGAWLGGIALERMDDAGFITGSCIDANGVRSATVLLTDLTQDCWLTGGMAFDAASGARVFQIQTSEKVPARVVLAGGLESMTNAPYLLLKALSERLPGLTITGETDPNLFDAACATAFTIAGKSDSNIHFT